MVHAKLCEWCGCLIFVQNAERYCLDCIPPPLEFLGYSLGEPLRRALGECW